MGRSNHIGVTTRHRKEYKCTHTTMADFDALQKNRMEKDLQELQGLIAQHFEKRKKEERRLKEEEEERKKKEDEERRKVAMQSMSAGNQGMSRDRQRGGNRRQTEREKKRKHLAERRKPLNIDHLTKDKLLEKVKEMHKHMAVLEEDKYDFEVGLDRRKYDIAQLRQRVNELNIKCGKGGAVGKGGKRPPKTLANVSARAGAFK